MQLTSSELEGFGCGRLMLLRLLMAPREDNDSMAVQKGLPFLGSKAKMCKPNAPPHSVEGLTFVAHNYKQAFIVGHCAPRTARMCHGLRDQCVSNSCACCPHKLFSLGEWHPAMCWMPFSTLAAMLDSSVVDASKQQCFF